MNGALSSFLSLNNGFFPKINDPERPHRKRKYPPVTVR